MEVRLSPKEADLLNVFCAHSDRYLSAKEAYDLAWDEPTTGWRTRFDTELTNLRGKLREQLPDLIENVRGRGYRLKVTASPGEGPSGTPAELEPKEISFLDLLSRLALKEHGGVLGRHAKVVVISAHPIELLPGYTFGATTNILAGNVSYVYLIPADALPIVAELVRTIAEATNGVLSNAPPATEPLADRAAVRVITKRLRIVLIPPPRFDSLYCLNAENEHLAEAYYCLHQDRRALRVSTRLVARENARAYLRLVSDEDRIIQFDPLLDRRAIEEALRAELLDRLAPDHLEWAALFLPTPADAGDRKPPKSSRRIGPQNNKMPAEAAPS